jgi:hypothetical protein
LKADQDDYSVIDPISVDIEKAALTDMLFRVKSIEHAKIILDGICFSE